MPKDSWNIFNERIINAILAQIYQFKAESCAGEADDWSKAEYYAKEARGDSRVENTVEEQKELNYAPAQDDYFTLDKPHPFALLRIAHPGDGGNNYAPWGLPNDPQQKVTPELFAMYDETDIRVPVFFNTVNDIPYWIKLRSDGSVDVCSESHPLFRISDLLLIEAEALARQGKSDALVLLNEFKSSKIPGYAGYSGSDVLEEILRERRKEFALEEQMRWLDMKRLGVSVTREALDDDNEPKIYKLEANDYRYALPIPEELELMYNNIPQNPGWLEKKNDNL
ncbi:MAG: RagB/SusD family nutrient uptake outer membrane protein [Butyricimonas faecihominis]